MDTSGPALATRWFCLHFTTFRISAQSLHPMQPIEFLARRDGSDQLSRRVRKEILTKGPYTGRCSRQDLQSGKRALLADAANALQPMPPPRVSLLLPLASECILNSILRSLRFQRLCASHICWPPADAFILVHTMLERLAGSHARPSALQKVVKST
jgi:hypothetical protein